MAIKYPEDFEIVQHYGVGDYLITVWKYTSDSLTLYLETSTYKLNAQMEKERKSALEKEIVNE